MFTFVSIHRSNSILKPLLPAPKHVQTLQHLRRLVTLTHLPLPLRSSIEATSQEDQTIFFLLPPPLPTNEEAVVAALRPHIHDASFLPTVHSTRIPLHPPTTAEQAASWSLKYWPCTYNPASQTIQNAPPLHLLRTVQVELDTLELEQYMQLAKLVAKECQSLNTGREVGAVIVDPGRKEVIAAAGDARWWTSRTQLTDVKYWGKCGGRPEHHALMRAIAMTAEKELQRWSGNHAEEVEYSDQRIDLEGRPLTAVEKYYFDINVHNGGTPALGGQSGVSLPQKQCSSRPETYLCSGLDVYLTHEPCVSCSMAMIHSRFRACVFEKRMPGTGGLCAEKDGGGLGYGMFWRRELNWRVMTFQYH